MKTTLLSRWAAPCVVLMLLAQSATYAAAPETVVTDSLGISGFDLYGNGALWWDNRGSCGGEDQHYATIRIRAADIDFGTKNFASNCVILPTEYDNAVRDDAYVYYFNNRQLYRKALSAPESDPGSVFATPPHAPTLPSDQPGTYLEIANGRLWFGRYRTDINRIDLFSIKTDGTESLQSVGSITSAGAPIRKMKWFSYTSSGGPQDALAILLANGRLYRYRIPGGLSLLWVGIADFSILRRPGLPLSVTYIFAAGGTFNPTPSTPAGNLFQINADSGLLASIYTAPLDKQLLSVLATLNRIFVTEGSVNCDGLLCFIDEISIVASPLGIGGSWGPIVQTGAGGNLRNDRDFLYFNDQTHIKRISLDAAPIQFDIQAIGLEAGHTVQDMNVLVSVPAGKDNLYVRGYASVPVNTTGQPVFFPSARLRAFVDGQEIPDSPFFPVNNTVIDVTNDMATLRPALNRSFLFVLPGLPAGSLTMTMTVNPNGSLPETDNNAYANNSVSLWQPIEVLNSIGVCLRMYPMATGMGTYDPNNPGFWEVISRADSLLPVRYLTVEMQPCLCGEVFFSEPFNFSDPDDDQDDDALDKIECIREQTSSEGASEFCRFRHWVGMIHPGVNVGGLGNTPGQSLITSMQEAGGGFPDPDSPFGGRTLAHEMNHNYGRHHINCGSPCPDDPDDCDSNYPFDPCMIGGNSANGFWGFDLLSRTVIGPTTAGDLMSYASKRWQSSYGWEGVLTAFSFLSASSLTAANAFDAGQGGLVLFVNGYIRPQANTAVFRTFFQLPADAVDAGNLAQDFAESLEVMAKPDHYFIRLLAIDGRELSRSGLPIDRVSDGSSRRRPFAHWIAFHPETRRIQLMRQNIVLAERIVSPRAPVLQVDPPIVDLLARNVRLVWRASDPDGDALLFNIHYSTDNGATWNVIANNYRGLAVSFDIRSLAGSDQARFRVTASDGVNSIYDVTDPFVLPKNAPQPTISGVLEEQRLNFGQAAQLFGAALDPEQDSRSVLLNWNLTGPTPRTGSNAVLSLLGLSPGAYTATLTATDADGLSAQAARHFEVLPLVIPEGNAPTLDGFCRDRAYTNAAFVQMPLGNGDFVPVRLIHSGSNLFVSFSDLQSFVIGGGVRRVGLRVDANASGDPAALPGDRGFFIDSIGIPSQEAGNGSNMVVTASPLPGFTAVLGAGRNSWSAEFRIADSLLGGWNHAARIMFDHNAPHWPAAANNHQPATWASAWFGVSPPPPTNRPPVAHAGSSQLINLTTARTIVLDGSASHDPDGNPLTSQWSQVSGPSVTLSNATLPAARFIVQPVTNTTSLRFRLVVNDGQLPSSPSEVDVTLVPTPHLERTSPAPALVHDGTFHAHFTGEPGRKFYIEATEDFSSWLRIYTNTADVFGIVDFMQSDMATYEKRFYRAVGQ